MGASQQSPTHFCWSCEMWKKVAGKQQWLVEKKIQRAQEDMEDSWNPEGSMYKEIQVVQQLFSNRPLVGMSWFCTGRYMVICCTQTDGRFVRVYMVICCTQTAGMFVRVYFAFQAPKRRQGWL